MTKFILGLILTSCVITSTAKAEPASLAWWFLPEGVEDLPHELEEDSTGWWTELWERPTYESEVQPNTVMEQALGAKWVGLNPGKEGKPTKTIIVLGGKRIVEFNGEDASAGTIDEEKITWSNGTKELLYKFRKHRRRRRGTGTVKFEKINLPPLASREKNQPAWSAEGLERLLTKLSGGLAKPLNPRDLSGIAQISDPNGSLLNFRYSSSCDFKDREKIEDVLAREVEPKLTCWMSQNTEAGSRLLAALLQRPVIECKPHFPMTANQCAMATVPHVEAFPTHPRIYLGLNRCEGELPQTLIHEIFHLAGIDEKPELLLSAVQDSESCASEPATLNFENQGEGFRNDFQVQTRMFIFRKVRDEAGKWGWSESEKSFFLGTICSRMGDKYCARNFFQKAAEGMIGGNVQLPEGTEVSWYSLTQYEFFESISEDIQRMHELVRYLHRDPNGTLLRRSETGTHRLHEFFVARQALEAVLNNKRVCSSATDEHVLCEDLAQITKTPWFRNP